MIRKQKDYLLNSFINHVVLLGVCLDVFSIFNEILNIFSKKIYFIKYYKKENVRFDDNKYLYYNQNNVF